MITLKDSTIIKDVKFKFANNKFAAIDVSKERRK